jgi:transcriptional regulator with XRE-family HTH domain
MNHYVKEKEGGLNLKGVLGSNLTRLRALKGSTISDVSHGTGLARETVRSLEEGRRGAHTGTLQKLAEYYGTTVRDLLGWDRPAGEVARSATVKQAVAYRQAIARAWESETPQTITATHWNEAFGTLIKRPVGELAESLLDAEEEILELQMENARLRAEVEKVADETSQV